MVRSLSIQKVWPRQPTRRCAINGVRPDSSDIVSALAAITGLSAANSATEARRSHIAIASQVISVSGNACRIVGIDAK